MAESIGIILEHIKELRQDNITNARAMGELISEVKNLHNDIKELRDGNEKLHSRIDRYKDEIRDLENKVNTDEQKFVELRTEIDTTRRTNSFWIVAGAAVSTAIATIIAIFVSKMG